MTTETKAAWYGRKQSSGQGMIAEEGTGRTVAVAYDDADTDLLGAAPSLLSALRLCAAWMEQYRPMEANKKSDAARNAVQAARAAIAQAEGR